MLQHVENAFAEFWIDRDILFFIYRKGVVIDLEAARLIVADRLSLQQGKAYPAFCDPGGIKDSSKAARDYLAKEGSQLVKAVALLVETPLARIMLNFYLTINKPLVPTKIFKTKDKALQYLETYLLEDSYMERNT